MKAPFLAPTLAINGAGQVRNLAFSKHDACVMRKYAHEQPDADERDLYEKLVSRFLFEDVCHCLFQVIMRTSNSILMLEKNKLKIWKTQHFHCSSNPRSFTCHMSHGDYQQKNQIMHRIGSTIMVQQISSDV